MGIKIGNTDISKIKIASGLTPRLPSAYQEVEWIGCDSSGPYIDTGVLPKDSTLSQIKFMNLAVTGYVIYGMYNGDDNTSYRLFNYQSTIYFDLKNVRSYTGTGNTLNPNTLYEFEVGNNYVKNVGASSNLITGTTVSSYTGNTNIMLNGNNSGNISRNRWYYVKIWEGDTQVRDFIPCYRIADDVIGMYDLVNGVFYTNAGSGTFTKGADVNLPYKEIRKVYLGSTQVRPSGWQPGANTIAYYPLNSTNTVNDLSGNNYNLTNTNVTFGTYDGVDCAYFNGNALLRYTDANTLVGTTRTFSMRGKFPLIGIRTSVWCGGVGYYENSYGDYGQGSLMLWCDSTSIAIAGGGSILGQSNISSGWNNVVLAQNGADVDIYINGTLVTSVNNADTTGSGTSANSITVGTKASYGPGDYKITGYVGETIVENIKRTATEAANYFNATKSNYGF